MSATTPAVLAALLTAHDPTERERRWEEFVAQYSRLIMHSVRRHPGSHDDVMDRYTLVLEQLRADDFRRLRTWAADGRSQLSTWLVVVVKRLCHDHYRLRYGRDRSSDAEAAEVRERRRRLADLVADEIDPEVIAAEPGGQSGADADIVVRRSELHACLADALSTLDTADQLLLTLRFRDDLPASQIAQMLSLPTPFHVYRRLNRILDSLRIALRERGVEDSAP